MRKTLVMSTLRCVVSAVADEDATESPSTVAEPPRPPHAAALAAH